MILLIICICGTVLSYYLGLINPGPRYRGTPKGWILSILIGAILAGIFYAFSTFGLIVSMESLFNDF